MKAAHGNIKRYMTTILKSSLLLLAVAGGNAAFAQVPKADCRPLVFDASSSMNITQPGVYCMTADLIATSSNATHLTISSDNVTVDFNGYTMKAGGGSEVGVFVDGSNVTLRNGRISGFNSGIYINATLGVTGILIEGMQLDACTGSCIGGYASHSIFRSNIITKPTPAAWYAIYVYGDGNKFIGNTISGLNSNGFAELIGISAPGTNALVDGNIIEGDSATSTNSGILVGANSLVINNRISNVGKGVVYFAYLGSGNYSGNMTQGVTTPFTGGTDKGNNY